MNEINERLTRIEQQVISMNESMTEIKTGVNDIYYLLTGQELPAAEPVQDSANLTIAERVTMEG